MKILDARAHLAFAFANDAALSGLDQPEEPTNIIDLPSLVTYVSTGGFGPGSLDPDRQGVFSIAVDVRVAKTKDLADSFDQLMSLWFAPVTRVIHEAAATHFGGAVAMLGDPMGGPDQRPITFSIEPDVWVQHLNLLLAYRIVVTTQEGATDD